MFTAPEDVLMGQIQEQLKKVNDLLVKHKRAIERISRKIAVAKTDLLRAKQSSTKEFCATTICRYEREIDALNTHCAQLLLLQQKLTAYERRVDLSVLEREINEINSIVQRIPVPNDDFLKTDISQADIDAKINEEFEQIIPDAPAVELIVRPTSTEKVMIAR
jgi:hypothetical protein